MIVAMTRPSRSAFLAVGIALIVGPLIAAVLRIIAPGWLLMFVLIAMVVIIPAYVLQVVIAATGFLRASATFATAPRARRAVAAGWVTAVAPVVAAFVAVDANDGGLPASPLLMLIGGGLELEYVVNGIAAVALLVTVAGWVWLLVEWIIAMRHRRATR